MLKPGFKCSFPSSGPCCNEANQFKNGTECEKITDCTFSSTCNGMNATCPIPLPKPDNSTTCNGGKQVCYDGRCMHSICVHPDVGREACSITYPDGYRPTKQERTKQCQISCINDNGVCNVLEKSWTMKRTNSEVLSNLTNLQMIPGSSCNGGKGYCDVLDRCRDLDPEGAITRLTNELFNKETIMTLTNFLTEKWYIVLVSGIAFIAIMAAFIRCFSIHTPSSNPTLPQAYEFVSTLRRPSRTLHRMASFRDEPPPAYDEIAHVNVRNRASRPTGIEMTNVNRASRPISRMEMTNVNPKGAPPQ